MHPAVHRWLGSLRRHFDGWGVLYFTNFPPDAAALLAARYGVEVVPVTVDGDFWKPKTRASLCGQWAFLKDACTRLAPTGHVSRTDVWDVVFQDDPRKYVDFTIPKVVVSLEG